MNGRTSGVNVQVAAGIEGPLCLSRQPMSDDDCLEAKRE